MVELGTVYWYAVESVFLYGFETSFVKPVCFTANW